MDKKELYKQLAVKEAQFEKAKERRAIKTILAFAAVFFLLLCWVEEPTGIEFVWTAVSAVVMAGIHFVVNAAIFGMLSLQSESERKYLEDLRKQLSE
jgi:hypothetical protein